MASRKVLVIGNGSREHAISWKLSQSSQVSDVFVAPGNGGIQQHGGKVKVIELDVTNFASVTKFCKDNSIDLVMVGPEDPLSKGISDSLNGNGIPCFGPSKSAARIESEKAFAKDFMLKHGVPTARYQNFTDAEKAKDFVRTTGALVVKASGLAGGKGVIVAVDKDEAIKAIDDIMVKKVFGNAGNEVVVEEFLEGDEVSIFAFSDGRNFQMMLPAQDHKRAYAGDQGPNTGGMGAYCPYPFLEQHHMDTIRRDIFERTINGMNSDGYPFVGLLYAGLIITNDGPKVIEFNCRFGDPETQSVLALLKSDLYDVLQACMLKTIKDVKLEWENKYAVGVVVASGGYPGTVQKNIEINGLDKLDDSLLVFHGGTVFRDGKFYTNGGRILSVVALDDTLEKAASRAIAGAQSIDIEKSFIRNDIGFKSIRRLNMKLDYKSSGVDIDAGNRLVEHIKKYAKRTTRSGVMEQIGGFGALFDLKLTGLKDPILVSGTDGVGTKLKIAIDTGKLDTVGIDLVAMCVNDILVQGAEPLFFLDYFACSHLEVEHAASVIKGIAEGCELSNAALVGGETAEMPGMYAKDDFDLAGFAVGAVERNLILPRKNEISNGDVIIGLSSSGVHSNGFSLVRKVFDVHSIGYETVAPFDGRTFGEVLLTPTKIYVRSTMPVIKQNLVKALAHITGGGLTENIPRVLEPAQAVELDATKWPIPSIFTWLKSAGNISDVDMLKTFNCGLGMILVVEPTKVDQVLNVLEANGEKGHIIGKLIPKQTEQVIVHNFSQAINSNRDALFKVPSTKPNQKKRVAVLISGSGTNLRAIINYVTKNQHKTSINLALVISDKKSAEGLKYAQEAAIPIKVLTKKKEQSRDEYDQLITRTLEEANIEVVCLAGFMRLLSEGFVTKWLGKMINIHPAILPSFKGMDAYGQALEAGVKITGCTVHYVTTEMDAGPIIAQDIVRIQPDDTVESLTERGKSVEHQVYPGALELVASGRVSMTSDGKLAIH
ncbi:hypothetical protein RDWZM_007018 [Blomia tropicalis]|uniref:Trifunctional purine biosynthetic protein adenosine-3 n=1 Tax=Blomia tropicalis TaxID=40697 RepID=A0A9Q0M875_BLOTA|nr:hypothetical protein RDWZM_007018 [Blomia tropicalis]